MKTVAIILAGGQGTRMRSSLPKVMHPLLGRPLVWYSVNNSYQVTQERPVLVVGYGKEVVQAEVGEAAEYVVQEPQLGTGHAVQVVKPVLQGKSDLVLVTYADMPLLQPSTLTRLMEAQKTNSGPLTMLTVIAEDPRGFGRIIRNSQGHVIGIVEEAHATPEQRLIRELNVSVYCFNAAWLWDNIQDLPLSPKGEYYLTDMVAIATQQGLPVQAFTLEDGIDAIGINTRIHLAEAETAMRRRINERLMLTGVSMVDPASTYIEPEVVIGKDTVVWPNTYIQGKTIIGEGCEIGPNTVIRDTQIGSRCTIFSSVLEKARVEDDVDMGPFAHLRKGAHLAQGVHMGNFGEVKNSYLGPGTKMGHFSYLGDATLEADVNVGAGTITCNFDGVHKNPTKVGKGAFIGSDTMLVAPVELGEGARTGAGAVVTKNVAAHSLAVGVPARTIRKLEKHD